MKSASVFAAAALGAAATDCSYQLMASGGAAGKAGQLGDGQIRIGGPYAPASFKFFEGYMRDAIGRGCISTPPTGQIQCDAGVQGDRGFKCDNGALWFRGQTNFWSCPVNDHGEWNIYTKDMPEQKKCVRITISCQSDCPVPPTSPVWKPTTVPAWKPSTQEFQKPCNVCDEEDDHCHNTCFVTKTQVNSHTSTAWKTATVTSHKKEACDVCHHDDDECQKYCTVTKTKTKPQTWTAWKTSTATKKECHACQHDDEECQYTCTIAKTKYFETTTTAVATATATAEHPYYKPGACAKSCDDKDDDCQSECKKAEHKRAVQGSHSVCQTCAHKDEACWRACFSAHGEGRHVESADLWIHAEDFDASKLQEFKKVGAQAEGNKDADNSHSNKKPRHCGDCEHEDHSCHKTCTATVTKVFTRKGTKTNVWTTTTTQPNWVPAHKSKKSCHKPCHVKDYECYTICKSFNHKEDNKEQHGKPPAGPAEAAAKPT